MDIEKACVQISKICHQVVESNDLDPMEHRRWRILSAEMLRKAEAEQRVHKARLRLVHAICGEPIVSTRNLVHK